MGQTRRGTCGVWLPQHSGFITSSAWRCIPDRLEYQVRPCDRPLAVQARQRGCDSRAKFAVSVHRAVRDGVQRVVGNVFARAHARLPRPHAAQLSNQSTMKRGPGEGVARGAMRDIRSSQCTVPSDVGQHRKLCAPPRLDMLAEGTLAQAQRVPVACVGGSRSEAPPCLREQSVKQRCSENSGDWRCRAEPLLLRAARGEAVERPPCWWVKPGVQCVPVAAATGAMTEQAACRMMRQAGRYQKARTGSIVLAACVVCTFTSMPCPQGVAVVQAYRDLADRHPSFRTRRAPVPRMPRLFCWGTAESCRRAGRKRLT